jgi:hypothetical protein
MLKKVRQAKDLRARAEMASRKRPVHTPAASAKRRARLRIGTPPPATTITPKTLRPPKHKKQELLEE